MRLTDAQIYDYRRDGFVLVPEVFSQAEVRILLDQVEAGGATVGSKHQAVDSQGRGAGIQIWHEISDDVFGKLSTSPHLLEPAAQLLGEPAAHFHSKIMMKEPSSGGAWEWHQDYGYWYLQGFVFPKMLSAMVALDEATKQNGCLKVLVGSHLLDRLDHGRIGSQQAADPDRIPYIEQLLPVQYLPAAPGSVIYFHCNTLHASEANLSDKPRRAIISAFNGVSNRQIVNGELAPPLTETPASAVDAILTYPALAK